MFAALAASAMAFTSPAAIAGPACPPETVLPGAVTNGNLALLEDLASWIARNTGYSVQSTLENPPEIKTCVTGDTLHVDGKDVIVDDALRAAYGPVKRVIYLVEPWSADVVEDQARLLHELIHDIQSRDRAWSCPNEQEWEAYKLHEKWLLEHGIDPHFNWVQILILSHCRTGIHQ